MKSIVQNATDSMVFAAFARILLLLVFCANLFAAPAPRPVQLRVSSIPSDRVTALQLTITAVSLRATDGSTDNLVMSPRRIEFKHLGLDSEPLVVGFLYPLQYESVDITVTSSALGYLRNGIPVKKVVERTFTSSVQFAPAMELSYSKPTILNLQLDMKSTVVLSSNGNLSVYKPVFRLSSSVTAGPDVQKPENGRVDRVVGSVLSVSGQAFTIADGQTGAVLTFDTDSTTQFINAGISTLPGLIVGVKGITKADGFLQATIVEALESANGSVIEGLVSRRLGKSAQLLLVSQGGSGYQIAATIASTVLADRVHAAFTVDTHGFDMTGLDFLQFDDNSIALGQHVQLQSIRQLQTGSLGALGSVIPDYIRLEPQTIAGVIANFRAGADPSTASFDLMLPANAHSYLRTFNPRLFKVRVYQQQRTDIQNLPGGVANGRSVRVRGLLFLSEIPSSNSRRVFVMVAGRIANGL